MGMQKHTYTTTDVNTEVDVLVGVVENVSPPFDVMARVVVVVSAGWGIVVVCGGFVDC